MLFYLSKNFFFIVSSNLSINSDIKLYGDISMVKILLSFYFRCVLMLTYI